MRIQVWVLCGLTILATEQLHAQTPLPANAARAVDAAAGNNVLQLHYLSRSPIRESKSDLDYGVLLSENREFVGTAALMFDTQVLRFVPGLSLNIGPQGYIALLNASKKADVFAVAIGADARFELIRRLGVAAFGSAFYSPGVLTFGSAHNLYDFTAGGEIRLTSRLTAFGGYRWFKYTLVNLPDDKVSNEVFAGIRWRLD